ncbi:hypothetical protein L228DRAFT_263108 [Xylona heveae TC161]|uniref:Uncharacterized protein n=1 Tax=Xylona heveae (strain CBS 132557 / TC161) TaxID=1328760 RepID=A0A165AH55_XYLHT|nr:hypothetical protein L228DRAFT_263108 [Xylona heveae TC161]KZF20463.1 hypothetical protein L228DRAFT_263108 [Xylona heveae TC161]
MDRKNPSEEDLAPIPGSPTPLPRTKRGLEKPSWMDIRAPPMTPPTDLWHASRGRKVPRVKKLALEVRLFLDFEQCGEKKVFDIERCLSLKQFLDLVDKVFEGVMLFEQVDTSELQFISISWQRRTGTHCIKITPEAYADWEAMVQVAKTTIRTQRAGEKVAKVEVHIRDENKRRWAEIAEKIKLKLNTEDTEKGYSSEQTMDFEMEN